MRKNRSLFQLLTPSPTVRWHRSKIGTVIHVSKNKITVKCPDDPSAIVVERVSWENVTYVVNKETKEICEEVIGEFIQHPLRLAWAITVHKSQGLTFERAIIDAKAAFSPGQVYVALSRCKTFEGMVLITKIPKSAIRTDSTVEQFAELGRQNAPTQKHLRCAKILYQQKLIEECFDCQPLRILLRRLLRALEVNKSILEFSDNGGVDVIEKESSEKVLIVSEKFKFQLHTLFDNTKVPEEDSFLQRRLQKASSYFSDTLRNGLVKWVNSICFETDNQEVRKTVKKASMLLQHALFIKLASMESCQKQFSTIDYLSAVAKAEIDFKTRASDKNETIENDRFKIEHINLLYALKEWRKEKAQEAQVDPHRILRQRVLIQVAIQLPRSSGELMKIKGIGKQTLKEYGAQLKEMVCKYCQENQI